MDGTSKLYEELMRELSSDCNVSALVYPGEMILSYQQLLQMVQFMAPVKDEFVLVAESYSTPLAIQYAATLPKNLKGVILCAGFASSPLRGWRKPIARLPGSILFSIPLTDFVIERFLVGANAPESLRVDVRKAINSTRANALSSRLAEILNCNVQRELSEVSVPILYIQAEEDRLIGNQCLEEMLLIKPDICVEKIRGPHLLFQREPRRAAEIIRRFAKTVLTT